MADLASKSPPNSETLLSPHRRYHNHNIPMAAVDVVSSECKPVGSAVCAPKTIDVSIPIRVDVLVLRGNVSYKPNVESDDTEASEAGLSLVYISE